MIYWLNFPTNRIMASFVSLICITSKKLWNIFGIFWGFQIVPASYPRHAMLRLPRFRLWVQLLCIEHFSCVFLTWKIHGSVTRSVVFMRRPVPSWSTSRRIDNDSVFGGYFQPYIMPKTEIVPQLQKFDRVLVFRILFYDNFTLERTPSGIAHMRYYPPPRQEWSFCFAIY